MCQNGICQSHWRTPTALELNLDYRKRLSLSVTHRIGCLRVADFWPSSEKLGLFNRSAADEQCFVSPVRLPDGTARQPTRQTQTYIVGKHSSIQWQSTGVQTHSKSRPAAPHNQ